MLDQPARYSTPNAYSLYLPTDVEAEWEAITFNIGSRAQAVDFLSVTVVMDVTSLTYTLFSKRIGLVGYEQS